MQLLHHLKLSAGQSSPAVKVEERTAALVLMGGAGFGAVIEVSTDGLNWVPLTTIQTAGVTHVPQGSPFVRVRVVSGTADVQIGSYGATWQNLVMGAGTGGGLVGATSFLELSDTPDVYLGKKGYFVAVNDTETGLVFVPAPVTSGGSNTGTGTAVAALNFVQADSAANLTNTNGARLTLPGIGTLAMMTDGIKPPPPPTNHAQADDYTIISPKETLDDIATPQYRTYGRGFLQFTVPTLVGGVDITFGVQRFLWPVADGSTVLKEMGFIPPTNIAIGYLNDAGKYVWFDSVPYAQTNNTVNRVRLLFPTGGISTMRVAFDFWTTEGGLNPRNTGGPSFAVGEVSVVGPSNTRVLDLLPNYRVLGPNGVVYPDPQAIQITSLTRLSVVDASGAERAAAFVNPGETWRYSETQ